MLTQEQFVANVWEKHEQYLQGRLNDNFYNKHQYKNINIIRNIKTVLTSLLSVMILSGAVYAGYSGVSSYLEGKLLEEKKISNINDHTGNLYLDDMNFDEKESVYYKIINNYNEYLSIKNHWNEMLDLKEEDFVNDFVVIIKPVITDYTNKVLEYRVIDIKEFNDELKIYIDMANKYNMNDMLIKDETGKIIGLKEKNSIIVKLTKDIYKDKISIINNYINSDNEKIPLEDINSDYTKEKAIADGCFVILGMSDDRNQRDYVVSPDNKLVDKFFDIENSDKDNFIRIIYYPNENQMLVKDISYKNGEYFLIEKNIDKVDDKVQYFNYVFSDARLIDEKYNGDYIRVIKFYKIFGLEEMNQKEQPAYIIKFRDYKETTTD